MKTCELVIGSIDNIVARGNILEIDTINPTIHGRPLSAMNYRVTIDFALEGKGEIEIPIPVDDEIVTVNDAVGSIVEWPKSLVALMGDTLVIFSYT